MSADNLASSDLGGRGSPAFSGLACHPELLDESIGHRTAGGPAARRENRGSQWSTTMRNGAASPIPSSAQGRGLACLHLADGGIGRDIDMAIAKLADPHRRPTTATTSDYPLRHMRMLPSALNHPLHHSKLRPPATRTQERGPIDIACSDEPIDAARAHRMPEWQPSRAAPLQLLLRRAAEARMTEPPPTDLLGPKHRHEPNSLTPCDGRLRLPPLQRDAKAATIAPRRPAIPVADSIRRVKPQRRGLLEWVALRSSSNLQQVLGIAILSADPTGLLGSAGAEYLHACSARRRNPLRYDTRQSHRGGHSAASSHHPSVARYRAYFPGRANQLPRVSIHVQTT